MSSDAIEITFTIRPEHGPAFRAAVEEISEELGGRLQASHLFAREASITRAVAGMGALRRAVCAKVPAADPHYPTRWHFAKRRDDQPGAP